jgi:hypothetical protein
MPFSRNTHTSAADMWRYVEICGDMWRCVEMCGDMWRLVGGVWALSHIASVVIAKTLERELIILTRWKRKTRPNPAVGSLGI